MYYFLFFIPLKSLIESNIMPDRIFMWAGCGTWALGWACLP